MKPIILALLMLVAPAAEAWPVRAVWTGKQVQVQTVTYKWMWRCEYLYNGERYYFLFENVCPSYVEIE
jgi:hypothetical protein